MTNRSIRLRLTLCLFLPAALTSVAAAKDQIANSVVKLHVVRRTPDFSRPWSKAAPQEISGTGVVIEGNRILTNAHVAAYASRIYVQPDQSTDKIRGTVEAIAIPVDLAVIKLEDETFFKTHPALPFREGIPTVKEQVSVYGFPMGGEQLSITEGIVSRIEYVPCAHGANALRIQVDAALNPGNSGGPAVVDGKIAGIVFSGILQADNIGYLIANEEVRRFLDDVKDGKYDGKPMIGGSSQPTVNPALREQLGLSDDLGGLAVRSAWSDDEAYPLKPGDVILRIGDYDVDREGYVHAQDDLRLFLGYAIDQAVQDGKVPMTVFRDGKKVDISVPAHQDQNLVIPFLGDNYPSYYIHGPLILMTATQELAGAVAAKMWPQLAQKNSPLITRLGDRCRVEGEQIVCLGVQFFPHPITKGYEGFPPFTAVESIDGVKLKNLKHAIELLKTGKDKFVTITPYGDLPRLVFRRQELADATEEILDDEGIRNRCSDDLSESRK